MNRTQSELLAYLQAVRSVTAVAAELVYRGPSDFLLQHGEWHEVVDFPGGVKRGLPKHCFGNAILLSATKGWKYIEGYAMAPITEHDYFPTHHAWNVDDRGKLVDSTWLNTGLAYFGVVFSVERADEATWDGDASVLEDWHRGYPLFRGRWLGETPSNAVRASWRIELLRAGKMRELYHRMALEGA